MNEVSRLKDQLARTLAGGAWHGPSLNEALSGVSAEQAKARPIPSAHTIWEIVRHVVAWEKVILSGIKGHYLSIPEEEDWPKITDTTEANWQKSLKELKEVHHALEEAVSKLSAEQLDSAAEGTKDTVGFFVHGIIQHNIYHAGQMALLKKVV